MSNMSNWREDMIKGLKRKQKYFQSLIDKYERELAAMKKGTK